MKCDVCWKEFGDKFPDIKYNDWLKLYHYFEHEYNEDEISLKTHESMVDCLMAVKPWPDEVKEE